MLLITNKVLKRSFLLTGSVTVNATKANTMAVGGMHLQRNEP